MKLRHEFKYSVSTCEYLLLRQRLRATLSHDGHVNADGEYRIRSLYFDNVYDKALREKLDGAETREKFRIRAYNFDWSYIALEKKSKYGSLSEKRSARLTRAEVERLLAGDLDWMPARGDKLVTELYAKMSFDLLRPRTVVDYLREPFVYPPGNVRVTLDRDVRTALLSQRFFDPSLPTLSASENEMILEVKYDEFLPDLIRGLVNTGIRSPTSFSKYANARRYG